MQILGLIAVMSWIVMGAAAIEVSRALGKQVCIGRLFVCFPVPFLEDTKTIKHKASSAVHWCYCCDVLLCLLSCRLLISTQISTPMRFIVCASFFFIAFI